MEKINYGYIYCIINTINNKKYIGATSQTVKKRWEQHLSDAKNNRQNGCTLLKNVMREYGKDYFTIECIIICNLEQLDYYETKFIELYNTLPPNGYNLKTGGNLGSKHFFETKNKIGNAHKNKVVSEKTKELTGKSSKYRNMSDDNKILIKNSLKFLNLEDLTEMLK